MSVEICELTAAETMPRSSASHRCRDGSAAACTIEGTADEPAENVVS